VPDLPVSDLPEPDLPECHVFIAMSLDGFIARPDGDIDWLTTIPMPKGEDGGYAEFISGMDGILMGRGSWDKVKTFPEWPYALPVTVASRSLPPGPTGPVTVDARPLRAILADLGARGHRKLYVDGGQIISALLRERLVTRMTVTVAPVLIGTGLSLFVNTGTLGLTLISTRSWPPGFAQMTYAPAPR
jgi:dihydrofolate reductase